MVIGVGLAGIAAVVAASAVRRYGEEARTTGLWWVAAALGAVAVVPAYGSGVPVPAALAAGGLVAAAIVDGVEHRIPTRVAHGTTAVSGLALVVRALVTGEWWIGVSAVLFTAGLVAAFTLLWLIGGMGFGDVRLAAAVVTGLTGGLVALLALVYVAFIVAGVTVGVRWLRRRERGDVSFGPGLVLGWVAALLVA